MRIAVVGAGLMGAGIAQVSAVAGHDVVLQDVSQDGLARGVAGIEKSLAKFAQKGKLSSGDVDLALDRITDHDRPRVAAGQLQFIVEAVFEKIDIKAQIFRGRPALVGRRRGAGDEHLGYPITSIAAFTSRGSPQHGSRSYFFSPVRVPMMALCDSSAATRPATRTLRRARAITP